jgi:hypothetical protein
VEKKVMEIGKMTMRERFLVTKAKSDNGWIVQINCGVVRIQICRRFDLWGFDGHYAPYTGMFVSLIPIPCVNGQLIPTLRLVRKAA